MKKRDLVFTLHHPDELPQLFDFLDMEPIQVPDWRAPLHLLLDVTEAQARAVDGTDRRIGRGSRGEQPGTWRILQM